MLIKTNEWPKVNKILLRAFDTQPGLHDEKNNKLLLFFGYFSERNFTESIIEKQ